MNKIVFEIRDPADARLAVGSYAALYPKYPTANYVLLNYFGKPLSLPFGTEIDCSICIDPETGVLSNIDSYDFGSMFRVHSVSEEIQITTISSKTYTEQIPPNGFSLLDGKVKTFDRSFSYYRGSKTADRLFKKSLCCYELDVHGCKHPDLSEKREICFTVPPDSDFAPWNGYTGSLHFGQATERFLRNYGVVNKNATIHIVGSGDSEMQLKAFIRTARSILKFTERSINFHYVYLKYEDYLSIAEDYVEFDLELHPLPDVWAKQDGKGFSAAVFAKNIAYSFVPEDVKTVIWVDNDLMAQGDISPFADNDPAAWDSPFAAVYLPKWQGPDYRIKDQVIKAGAINGGLIIQNVNKCREMFGNTGEKLIDVWKSIESFSEYPDEDLMLYCSKQLKFDIQHIDTVYCYPHGHLGNALFIHFIHIYKPWKRWVKYSLKNVDSHCYGSGKPWSERSVSLRHYSEFYCPFLSSTTTQAGQRGVDVYEKGVKLSPDIADIFYSNKRGEFRAVVEVPFSPDMKIVDGKSRPFTDYIAKDENEAKFFEQKGVNWQMKLPY